MRANTNSIRRQRLTDLYRRLIVAAGAVALLYSVCTLPAQRLDFGFLLLFLFTVVVSSRVSVPIPRVNATVTVSDTFIFLTVLLYGVEAAVLLAAAEGLCAGARLSRRPLTILCNSGALVCATFLAGALARLAFGEVTDFAHLPISTSVSFICLLVLAQYATHTGIGAGYLALKQDEPVWRVWVKHYLWSSVTYFIGGLLAGVFAKLAQAVSFYSLLFPLPVIAIVYFSYRKYLEEVRTTAAQAERAEHERAEAERQRAEQAERHVIELELANAALKESREHFRHAAYHDSLTELPNRVLLTDRLRLAIERTRRHAEHSFALIFLDLDRFKYVNDSLGHAAGDQLLVNIARRLAGHLRPTDMVARLGGDEFAILLDDLEDEGDAIRVAERVQEELTAPCNLGGHEVFMTASIGIALSSPHYADPENVLRDADTAMYRAKENGKARYELFDAVMHARAVERLRLENDLRRAVERNEILVHYQPIISLDSDRVAGFEALARWEHPERGFVPPAEFIPVAEETGLIVEIGRCVLREACRQMREWQRLSFDNRLLSVSVNLSGRQFLQPNLIGSVKQILHETDLDPSRLKLEITESVMMENAEEASALLVQLRAMGVQLSIDDFGTGYSSLSYLHRFPVDTLKIDRSFVMRMGDAGENSEIVRTILTLASTLGMDVVAEGVETKGQLAQLKAMSCPYGQGYLFSKPLNAVAAGDLVGACEAALTGRVQGVGRPGEDSNKLDSGLVM